MFYIPQAIAVWIAAFFLVDWRRIRELFVYALLGGYLAMLQDQIGIETGLWEYRESIPAMSHSMISILISLSAAPIFAMIFVQGLKPGGPIPWGRIFGITAVAMIPEIVGLYTGNMVHHNWWNAGASIGAYIPLWILFWAIHRWQSSRR